MQTKTKLMIGGGLVLASFLVSAFGKVKSAINAAPDLDFVPASLPKALSISLKKVSFKIDVKIINRSAQNIDVSSGGLAKLKRLIFIYDNKELANVAVDLNSFQLNAGQSITLYNLPIELMLSDVLQVAPNFINQIQTGNLDFEVGAVVEVFGNQYTY